MCTGRTVSYDDLVKSGSSCTYQDPSYLYVSLSDLLPPLLAGLPLTVVMHHEPTHEKFSGLRGSSSSKHGPDLIGRLLVLVLFLVIAICAKLE